MRVAPIALWLVSGCHALFGLDEVMLEQPIDGAVDASIDARMRFGTPQRVAVTVPPGYYANDVTLTGDQQQMRFVTYDLATGNNPDVWVAESTLEPF